MLKTFLSTSFQQLFTRSFTRSFTRPAGWLFLALCLLIAALLFVGDPVQEALRYSREDILQGEWWRLVSGHLLHLNVQHGLMNLGALLLTILIVGNQLTYRQWWLSGLFLCLFISLGLCFVSPEVVWYVGLSGVLHGLLALGLLLSASRRDWLHALVLLGLLIKVVHEQMPGFDVNHLQNVIDGAVVVEAHAWGFAGGILLALLFIFLSGQTGSKA